MNENEFLEIVRNTAIRVLSRKGIFEDIVSEVTGGKMIRPRAIFAIANSFDVPDPNSFVPLAASTEIVHLASLFHDDVIDNGMIRRGRPTLNARYGNLISILAGDYFYSTASHLVLENYPVEVARIFAHSVSYMTLMELKQATMRWNINLSQEEYFDIIRGKTGALFSASFESAGVILGMDDTVCLHLREAGMLFGEIFQITDDLLDFIGTKTGKIRLKDISEGDITLPAILLIEAEPEVRSLLMEYFSSKGERRDVIERLASLIEKKNGYIDSIRRIVEEKRDLIDSHLSGIVGFNKDRFIPLLNSIIKRER
jgi:geranylgeranyl pyrophosphate synthase